MLLDIVRADGAVVRADGSRVRAATNCALGSDGDRMLTVGYFIDSEDAYARQGEVRIGRIRAGTRLLGDDGKGLVVPRRACGTRFRILRGRAGRTGGRGTASVLLLWRAAAAGGLHSEEKRLHPRPVARRRREYGRDGRHSGSRQPVDVPQTATMQAGASSLGQQQSQAQSRGNRQERRGQKSAQRKKYGETLH